MAMTGGVVDVTAAIDIQGLVKTYGSRYALNKLDLRVEPGSVFGFLGANGAGKTTTLRIILALAMKTAGRVKIFGHDPGSAQLRPLIGYCPDVPGFLPWMTARDVMESTAALFQLPHRTARHRVRSLLELTGLAHVDSRVSGYSRGMRQRLGLAQALINSPQLLLLDEPTSALDPIGRRTVLDLISELRGKTTVFFSTHLLPDVERVCDSVAIVDAGQVIASGPIEQVRAGAGVLGDQLFIEVDRPEILGEALQHQPWVLAVHVGPQTRAVTVTVRNSEEAATYLPGQIVALGLRLHRLEPKDISLEDIFVGMVKNGTIRQQS